MLLMLAAPSVGLAFAGCGGDDTGTGDHDAGGQNDATLDGSHDGPIGDAAAIKCASPDAAVSPQCGACMGQVLGTQQSPGPCYNVVANACEASADCVGLQTCEKNCKVK
jgi:hypothetical protein